MAEITGMKEASRVTSVSTKSKREMINPAPSSMPIVPSNHGSSAWQPEPGLRRSISSASVPTIFAMFLLKPSIITSMTSSTVTNADKRSVVA